MVYNPAALISMGSFTSTGAAVSIQLDPGCNYFYLKNRTQWGQSANPAVVIQAEWFSNMANGSAYAITNSAAGSNVMVADAITSNGFTLIDPDNPITYAAVPLANPAFTQASQAVFSTLGAVAHNLSVGNLVVLTDLTGARQYASVFYTVAAVPTASTFTLLLNTVGVTQATAGFVQRVGTLLPFMPRQRTITGITNAASAVITLAAASGLVVGEYIRIYVPTAFGMPQMNGQLALVTAVNATPLVNSITVDINSTGFGTFAFPASATVPFTFPQIVPVGEVATILSGAEINTLFRGIQLGTAVVGANLDVIDWWQFNADITNQLPM